MSARASMTKLSPSSAAVRPACGEHPSIFRRIPALAVVRTLLPALFGFGQARVSLKSFPHNPLAGYAIAGFHVCHSQMKLVFGSRFAIDRGLQITDRVTIQTL